MSCQEDYYKSTENIQNQPLLGKLSNNCFTKPSKTLKITKYFGCGTYFAILSYVMYNYNSSYLFI